MPLHPEHVLRVMESLSGNLVSLYWNPCQPCRSNNVSHATRLYVTATWLLPEYASPLCHIRATRPKGAQGRWRRAPAFLSVARTGLLNVLGPENVSTGCQLYNKESSHCCYFFPSILHILCQSFVVLCTVWGRKQKKMRSLPR